MGRSGKDGVGLPKQGRDGDGLSRRDGVGLLYI